MKIETTPGLGQAINDFIDRKLSNVHTAYPARIESYDSTNFLASVSLELKKNLESMGEVPVPVFNNVPVAFPRSKKGGLLFPVEKGDSGLLIFSERSIDDWIELGRAQVPTDPRKLDYNDGIFFPGVFPKTDLPIRKGAIDSLELSNGSSYLEIGSNGGFKIQEGGTELIEQISELTSNINDLLTSLSTAMVATVGGPMPLSTAPDFARIKVEVTRISENINGLKI